MGKAEGLGSNPGDNMHDAGVYDWKEIQTHNLPDDKWIVIDEHVYDISTWYKKHPGGAKIISGYAGQDASDAWYAFHTDKAKVRTSMKALCIGKVKDNLDNDGKSTKRETPLMSNWHQLRDTVEQMGLYNVSILFYVLNIAHILFFDALGWFIMYRFGTSWTPYLIAALSITISQIQAGWTQHDYGHRSVFKSNKLNKWAHIFVISFIKGVSSVWWNSRHNNHHAKPNIIKKDPDTRMEMLFLQGNVLPLEYGKKKKGFMPYNHQHNYFHLIMPPLLFPVYFKLAVPYFLITRKLWAEMFWASTFYVRFLLMFHPLLGFRGVLGLYFFVRFLESHWFVWVTQMNHIPMAVDYDKDDDWVTMQLNATCNVEPSIFNDWFTGHLNYQIEHHLFPTMPRHNLHKALPLVKSLCHKHGLDYQCKTLTRAFADIVGSLQESGQIWQDAYHKQ